MKETESWQLLSAKKGSVTRWRSKIFRDENPCQIDRIGWALCCPSVDRNNPHRRLLFGERQKTNARYAVSSCFITVIGMKKQSGKRKMRSYLLTKMFERIYWRKSYCLHSIVSVKYGVVGLCTKITVCRWCTAWRTHREVMGFYRQWKSLPICPSGLLL